MLVRMLSRPRASESLISVVRWLNAPSAIPGVNHLHLIALGAAAAWVCGTLALRGRIANMLTRYPERFGALFCTMPVIDMRRYAKLFIGPAITDEYGDPDKPEDWRFLAGISAYHVAAPGHSISLSRVGSIFPVLPVAGNELILWRCSSRGHHGR